MIYLLCAIRRPCKVWQFQRWEKNRVKNCLSPTKPNTCCTKNSWSSGIMSNFFGGQLFYVLGGKKNLNFLLKNIAASAQKSCINKSLKKVTFFSKIILILKNWIITTKFSKRITSLVTFGLKWTSFMKFILSHYDYFKTKTFLLTLNLFTYTEVIHNLLIMVLNWVSLNASLVHFVHKYLLFCKY